SSMNATPALFLCGIVLRLGPSATYWLPFLVGRLVFRRRCFRESGEHPNFPSPTFKNIDGSPTASNVQRLATLVFSRHVIFAQPKSQIRSQWRNLIHCDLQVIKSGLESTFISICDICCGSDRSDMHPTSCKQRSDPCGILLIEVFNECRSDLFHLLH